MKKELFFIGACGLDCNECDIFAATDNPQLAGQLADWMKKVNNLYVDPRDVKCKGCRGDIECHWNANCWIRKCCIEDKRLDFCNECREFPCERLETWAKGDKKNIEALAWLKKNRKHKHPQFGEPRIL